MADGNSTLEYRFWSKVDKRGPNECWPWTACLSGKGYGQIMVDGEVRLATHISLEFDSRRRPPAPNNHALHGETCNSRACVNPGHLRWGSNAENADDRRRFGNQFTPRLFGEKNGQAKLGADDVRAIRKLTDNLGHIAAEFSISKAQVCRIKKRQRWGHVT